MDQSGVVFSVGPNGVDEDACSAAQPATIELDALGQSEREHGRGPSSIGKGSPLVSPGFRH
jgi:hypothetical protein